MYFQRQALVKLRHDSMQAHYRQRFHVFFDV